jgi:hypothetical protein
MMGGMIVSTVPPLVLLLALYDVPSAESTEADVNND